jgi:hypothetical protein
MACPGMAPPIRDVLCAKYCSTREGASGFSAPDETRQGVSLEYAVNEELAVGIRQSNFKTRP